MQVVKQRWRTPKTFYLGAGGRCRCGVALIEASKHRHELLEVNLAKWEGGLLFAREHVREQLNEHAGALLTTVPVG